MRRSKLSWMVVAAVLAACSSTPNNGNNNGVAGGSSGGGSGGSSGGGGSGGFGLEGTPAIQVKDVGKSKIYPNNAKVPISAGEVAVGSTSNVPLYISNVGSTGDLVISSASFSYDPPPGDTEGPALSCVAIDGGNEVPCNQFKFPAIAPVGGGSKTSQSLQVRFRRYADALQRSAVLCLNSNDTKKNQKFCLTFVTVSGQPKASVVPDTLDFGSVAVGQKAVAQAKLLNQGSADLVVSQFDLSALEQDIFKLVLDGKEYAGGAAVTFDPPMQIKPNDGKEFTLLYTTVDDKARSTELLIRTNDQTLVGAGEGVLRVPVKANSTGPCLIASPKQVVFGASPLGQAKEQVLQLKSCGDEAVVITDLALGGGNAAGNFAVKWESIAATAGKAPTEQAPLKIPVNSSALVTLVYTPDKLAPQNPLVLDTADLIATSNIAAGKTKVTLEGYGANSDCPTPIITIAEGDTVTPQTVLHLDGKQSYASGSSIQKYEWSVEQPQGAVGLILPNNKSAVVTFQPNVAGDYKFRLRVWDQGGKESCAPAEKVVKVIPDQAIHVELLWKTPGDKDESDSGPGVGSDLDLHFAHQYAAGQDYDGDGKPDPWFAGQYDCFWYNCGNGNTVQWGSYDLNVDDDPRLDRDDTDGAGPENLNLTLPEDGRVYRVGVHYYNDFGLGQSIATVRIYIYGILQFEVTSSALAKGDLWNVATVSWPQGEIEQVVAPGGSGFFITKKYPAPSLD